MSCIRKVSYLPLSADTNLIIPVFIETEDEFITPNYGISILFLIELILITLTLPQEYLLFRGLSKTALFHRNLCRIVQAHILLYCSAAIARVVMFLYQVEGLRCNDSWISKTPLVVALLIRNTCLVEDTGFIVAVIAERVFASFFIADYEMKHRLWIWRGIVSFIMVTSLTISCLSALPGVFLYSIIYCCVTIPISLISSACLLHRNRAKLQRLSKEPLGDCIHYTLSKKFQLIENIRTLKMVIAISLVMAAHAVIALGLMTMALTLFRNEPEKGHLCFAVLDLLNAISMLIEATVGCVVLGEWRRIAGKFYRQQSPILCCGSSITPNFNGILERQDITQVYFKQLRQAWET